MINSHYSIICDILIYKTEQHELYEINLYICSTNIVQSMMLLSLQVLILNNAYKTVVCDTLEEVTGNMQKLQSPHLDISFA